MSIIVLVLSIMDIFRYDMAVNMSTFVKIEEKNISNLLKYFLRHINYSVVCFQGQDSLKQIIILLDGKIMHVLEWVTETVNRDGTCKNLRHLKSQKNKLFSIFFCILGHLTWILFVQHSAN